MTERGPDTANLAFADELWREYKKDPTAVTAEWRAYFEEVERSEDFITGATLRAAVGRSQLSQTHGPGGKKCAGCGRAEAMSLLQYNVSQLIRNYRVRGHRLARVNPLEPTIPDLPELEPEFYGMRESDMELLFNAGSLSDDGPATPWPASSIACGRRTAAPSVSSTCTWTTSTRGTGSRAAWRPRETG